MNKGWFAGIRGIINMAIDQCGHAWAVRYRGWMEKTFITLVKDFAKVSHNTLKRPLASSEMTLKL